MSEPVRLAATLEGPAGAPVVVLGNSLGTTREVWEPQVAALGERFRLLRFEHRGHGGSPAPPGPYTIAELGADVLALLDGLGLRAVSYCGISLGGMIGMWLAAHAPERIGALGLCCTSAYLPPAGFWAGRAEQARAGGMASLSEQVVARWFTPAFRARDPAAVAGFVTTLEGGGPGGLRGLLRGDRGAGPAVLTRADLRPGDGHRGGRGPGHPALARGPDSLSRPRCPPAGDPGRLPPGQRLPARRGHRHLAGAPDRPAGGPAAVKPGRR
jgi:pimeloyl-ACP methyl ester carboxylesterase